MNRNGFLCDITIGRKITDLIRYYHITAGRPIWAAIELKILNVR